MKLIKQIEDYEIVQDWNEYFNAKKLSSIDDLHINRIVFRCVVHISETFNKSLIIDDCIFERPVVFRECVFNNSVEIFDSIFKRNVVIAGNKTQFNSYFNINNSDFDGDFLIANGEYSDFNICFNYCNKLIVSGGKYKELNISANFTEKSYVNMARISSNNIFGNIVFNGEESRFNTIFINGYSQNLKIGIYDIKINNIEFIEFKTDYGIRLFSIKPFRDKETKIKILKSYLGKSEFNSVEFKEYCDVEIIDSYISDCIFTNINWALGKINTNYKKSKIQFLNNLFDLYIYSDQVFNSKRRETFRQLKLAFQKTGDYITEQESHQYEILAYNSSLKWSIKNIGIKFIIILSHLTSDFGQSIIKPIFWLIIIHFFLTLILIGQLNLFEIDLTLLNPDYTSNKIILSKYFEYISPFRPQKEYSNINLVIVDIFMRIWTSYMIYNFIRASRRFIK